MKNKNEIINAVLSSLIIVACFCLMLVLFVDLPFIPTWKEITGEQAEIDKVSDSVIFLNIGEGDATLIKSNGRYALIDTGDGFSFDIVKKLKEYDVAGLDALILTHWHSDHIGAATEILDEFTVLNLVVPKLPSPTSELYADAISVSNKADEKNVNYCLAKQGLAVNVGDFRISVLYNNPEEAEENNRTSILMAKCRDHKFLFMADAEISLEEKLISDGYNLDCDVIKIGHHGSKSSTGSALLKSTTPKYAVISVGANNSYNHPSGSVLDALYYADVQVFRTDKQGEIQFTVDEDDIKVNTSVN